MKKKLLYVTIGLLFSVAAAHAGSVDTYGIGAKATALGGAYSAYADDPYAVYYNPAGLSQIEGKVFSIGTMFLDPTIKMSDFTVGNTNHGSFEDKSDVLVVPNMGYAQKINSQFSFGIALYAPWGLELEWDKDIAKNPGAQNAYHSYYMRYGITPGLAYKVNDKFSIGMGVTIGKSEAGVDAIEYGLFDVQCELEDDVNYSYNLGLMYKPIETVTFGLTYRSETDTDFEGDIESKDIPGGYKGKATLEYNHPQQIQAGVRYQPHEQLSLECDVVWTDWSINKNQVVELEKALGGHSELEYDRDWSDTKQLRFGIEYIYNEMFTLRGGYFYDPTPIPDDTLDMQWPDADKKTYSLGAGVNLGSFTVDTVIQYTEIEQPRILGGESDNLNGSYFPFDGSTPVSAKADGYIIGGGVTVSYKF